MVLQLSTSQIVCLVVSEYQSLQIVATSAMKHYNAYSGMHGGQWSKISFPFFKKFLSTNYISHAYSTGLLGMSSVSIRNRLVNPQ